LTPSDIKIAMLRIGISQSEIAEALNEERASVSGVINGRRTTRSIREAVAKAIGKPIADVFPDEVHRRPSGRIVKRIGFTA